MQYRHPGISVEFSGYDWRERKKYFEKYRNNHKKQVPGACIQLDVQCTGCIKYLRAFIISKKAIR